MKALPDEAQTYCKHIGGGFWFKRRELGEWICENFLEFNDAVGLWMKYKKHGPPWGHWDEAPAHLFDLLDAFDTAFESIQAEKVRGDGKR